LGIFVRAFVLIGSLAICFVCDRVIAAEKGKAHCPLCHQNIDASEDSWKQHLMGKNGCAENPRRTSKTGMLSSISIIVVTQNYN
jgi:hypothetical protein